MGESSGRSAGCRSSPADLAISELVVVGAAATLGRDPGDDPVGVGDVAGLAVDAVRGIEVEADLAVSVRGKDLVHVRRAEVLAGIAVLLPAAVDADGEVRDQEMARLILLVLRPRVVHVV